MRFVARKIQFSVSSATMVDVKMFLLSVLGSDSTVHVYHMLTYLSYLALRSTILMLP